MKIFGISTIRTQKSLLTEELQGIYDEALKLYDQVVLLNPSKVSYIFVRGGEWPQLYYENQVLPPISSFLVRSTKNIEAATALLVRTLEFQGCDVLDPIERFSVGRASKLLTTFSRFKSGFGTTSYIAFNKNCTLEMLDRIDKMNGFPILLKPIEGSKGIGIALAKSNAEARVMVETHFAFESVDNLPLLFQEYIQFKEEYRVLLNDGTILGAARKIKSEDQFVANAAQGAVFESIDIAKIDPQWIEKTSTSGLIGLDIGIDQNDEVHIIESNRAPQWSALEKSTTINFAKLIVENAYQRITTV